MSDQNKNLVRQGYEAFGRGDIDGLLNLLDDQIEWISPGPPELPTAGTRRGRQQVRDFFKTINDLYDFDRFEPQLFIAEGDKVVVLGVEAVRVRSTGKALTDSWAHVFTVSGGRITHFQEFMDMAAITAEMRAATARA